MKLDIDLSVIHMNLGTFSQGEVEVSYKKQNEGMVRDYGSENDYNEIVR